MAFVFLFPGQGSQTHRMGAEIYRDIPACRRLFEEADAIVGYSLTRLIFEGRAEDLASTDILQPALSLVNAASLEALREKGYVPAAVAGHSLGEYSACYAAGVFGFADLLQLTQARGRLMAAAAAANPGGMLAIAGLSEESIADIVRLASEAGVVCTANLNAPDQVVLSGETKALERATDLAAGRGARKVARLNVSGAWHSPLMSSSRADFERELDRVVFHDAAVDIYPNVTAGRTRSSGAIRQLLAAQYDSRVRWSETIANIDRDYPDTTYVEVGPGRVLTGLLLSINRRARVYHVDSPQSLEAFVRKAGAP